MMNDAIEVEVNLMASGKMKQKTDLERKKIKDEIQSSSSHSSKSRLDSMMKNMEKIMEILVVVDRPAATQHVDPQIRNPNFRRQQFPQIRQRNSKENQIKPPFQENTMVEELEENDDQIHCLDKEEPQFYIKKEDHDQFFA